MFFCAREEVYLTVIVSFHQNKEKALRRPIVPLVLLTDRPVVARHPKQEELFGL